MPAGTTFTMEVAMFLTEIGKNGTGSGVNTGTEAFRMYIHDLLLIAGRDKLEVSIWTDRFDSWFWDSVPAGGDQSLSRTLIKVAFLGARITVIYHGIGSLVLPQGLLTALMTASASVLFTGNDMEKDTMPSFAIAHAEPESWFLTVLEPRNLTGKTLDPHLRKCAAIFGGDNGKLRGSMYLEYVNRIKKAVATSGKQVCCRLTCIPIIL